MTVTIHLSSAIKSLSSTSRNIFILQLLLGPFICFTPWILYLFLIVSSLILALAVFRASGSNCFSIFIHNSFEDLRPRVLLFIFGTCLISSIVNGFQSFLFALILFYSFILYLFAKQGISPILVRKMLMYVIIIFCVSIILYSKLNGGGAVVYSLGLLGNGYLSVVTIYLTLFVFMSRVLGRLWIHLVFLSLYTSIQVYARSLLLISSLVLALNLADIIIRSLIRLFSKNTISRKALIIFFGLSSLLVYVVFYNISLSLADFFAGNSKFNFSSFSLFIDSIFDPARVMIVNSFIEQLSIVNLPDFILGPSSWTNSYIGLLFNGNTHNGILRLYLRLGLAGIFLVSYLIVCLFNRVIRKFKIYAFISLLILLAISFTEPNVPGFVFDPIILYVLSNYSTNSASRLISS